MSYPAYKTEIDSITEAEWSTLLGNFEDANIYQTWAYGAVRWGEKNLSHLVLKLNGKVLGMAQLRIFGSKSLNIGVAYLRWGPIFHLRGKDLDCFIAKALASALHEEYVVKRGLHLEVLPNAYNDSPRAQTFRSAFSQFECRAGISTEHYRTLVLDLSPSVEELRKSLDKKWRNQLNAAERNELCVREGSSIELYGMFCALYREMWTRKKFQTTVSVEDFRQIQQRLTENQQMRILLCEHEGRPVAGMVISAFGDTAIYLLGATNDAGLKVKAAYLLQWTTIQLLKKTGIGFYDLGGIDPDANPGVHHFKKGLSGQDLLHMSPLVACSSSFSAGAVKAFSTLRVGLSKFHRLVHA